MKTAGQWGEQLLQEWLTTQAWEILGQNWHCPWGELDLVALNPDQIVAFIEVKTRKLQSHSHSFDHGGLLAITPTKQAKLIHTAQLFLERYPHWADYPCRFDVALIQYQSETISSPTDSTAIILGQRQHYKFLLLNYIQNAFTL
jgi:putative endonuclease